jgi:hypothetical protein
VLSGWAKTVGARRSYAPGMVRVQLTQDVTGEVAAAVGVPDTVAGTVLVLDMPDAWALVTAGFADFADATRDRNRKVVAIRPSAA